MTQNDRPRYRLFVTAPLVPGARVALSGEQSHYLKNVMRAEAGAPLALFNGQDGEWLGEISALEKRRGEVTLRHQSRAQPNETDLRLVFAPLKKNRLDFLVEKAVELGATRLSPVFTAHTDVTRVNVERLHAQAREAAEQCERLTVPTVDAPVTLDTLLVQWGKHASDAPRLIAAVERSEAPSLITVLDDFEPSYPCAFLIGPEGGFSPHEVTRLQGAPFVFPINLGPRILRAETAAVSVLACHQMLLAPRRDVGALSPRVPSS